jgi:hypothetical protein
MVPGIRNRHPLTALTDSSGDAQGMSRDRPFRILSFMIKIRLSDHPVRRFPILCWALPPTQKPMMSGICHP